MLGGSSGDDSDSGSSSGNSDDSSEEFVSSLTYETVYSSQLSNLSSITFGEESKKDVIFLPKCISGKLV